MVEPMLMTTCKGGKYHWKLQSQRPYQRTNCTFSSFVIEITRPYLLSDFCWDGILGGKMQCNNWNLMRRILDVYCYSLKIVNHSAPLIKKSTKVMVQLFQNLLRICPNNENKEAYENVSITWNWITALLFFYSETAGTWNIGLTNY